jgi:hypothetical protein
MEIAPDARQMMVHGDSLRGEVLTVTDPGEHQQLRGLDGAGCQHDVAACPQGQVATRSLGFDRHGAPAFEDDTRGLRVGQHEQVGPSQRWPQHCRSSGLAHASANGELAQPHAFAVRAIQVLPPRVSKAGKRFEEGEVQAIGARDHAHVHRAVAAVVHARAEILVVLAPAEVGQDLAVAPAGGAGGGPAVEVQGMAPEIDHAIDEG